MVDIAKEIPSFVNIRGVVYPGHEKAPFVASGKSVHGCIAYKPENDTVQCHECGGWVRSIVGHIRKHSISPSEYRLKHGIGTRTALCSPGMSRKRSGKLRSVVLSDEARERMRLGLERGRETMRRKAADGLAHASFAETNNLRGNCQAQLLERLSAIQREFGGVVTVREALRRGIHYGTALYAFNVKTWRDLSEKLGFLLSDVSPSNPYTRDRLIDEIRDFYVFRGKLPRACDFGTGSLPTLGPFRRIFGSRMAAFEAAGFGLIARKQIKNGRPEKIAA